jgi:hypothetical protein
MTTKNDRKDSKPGSPKLPKNLSVTRGGQTLSGVVTRVSAEIVTADGRRVFKTLSDDDLAGPSTEPAQVNIRTPRGWTINEKFSFMADLIRMVIDDVTCSLVITGSGGLGKTSSVMAALKSASLYEGDGFVLLKGYSTPRGFYEFLYRNNGRLIVIDDCDSVFDTETGINILKGALDSFDNRTVCWQSRETSRDDDEDSVPRQFEFTGRIIFISNRTQEDVPQPIRSRSMNIDLTMTLSERIDRITYLLPQIASREGATMEQAHEAMELIAEHKDVIRDLNIRTAVMTIRVRKTAHIDNWKNLALFQLINN